VRIMANLWIFYFRHFRLLKFCRLSV